MIVLVLRAGANLHVWCTVRASWYHRPLNRDKHVCVNTHRGKLGDTRKEARQWLANRFDRLQQIAEHVGNLARSAATLAEDTRLAINLTCAPTRAGEHTCFTATSSLHSDFVDRSGPIRVSQPCIAT